MNMMCGANDPDCLNCSNVVKISSSNEYTDDEGIPLGLKCPECGCKIPYSEDYVEGLRENRV